MSSHTGVIIEHQPKQCTTVTIAREIPQKITKHFGIEFDFLKKGPI